MTTEQKTNLLKSVWATALALGPEVAGDRPEVEQPARALAFIVAGLMKQPKGVAIVSRMAMDLLAAQAATAQAEAQAKA